MSRLPTTTTAILCDAGRQAARHQRVFYTILEIENRQAKGDLDTECLH